MTKLSYKTLLIILFFLLIPIVFLLRLRQQPNPAAAGWWNDSWTYRKAINIGYTGTELTDFQVSFDIGTSALINAGKMQSDCDDIRITDSRGNLLPHWIEENNPGCNAATDTKIWLKAPTIPTGGATVYIYYGNSSATNIENGDNVFEIFEQFDSLPTDWTAESSPSTNWAVNSGELVSTTTFSDYSSFTKNSPLYTDFAVDVRWKYSGVTHGGINFRGQSGAADAGYQWIIRPSLQDNRIQIRQPAQSYPIPEVDLEDNISSNTWYNLSLKVVGTNINSYINGTEVLSGDMSNTTYTEGKLGFQHYDGTNYFDNFRVRKAVSSDPSSSLATEETGTAPIAYWSFDEGVGTTAHDSAGGNDGVINGATWQTEENCISGKCLSFDGNDYLRIEDANSLDTTSAISVSFWFKGIGSTWTSSWQSLVAKRNTGTNYGVNINGSTNILQWYFYDGSFQSVTVPTSDISADTWHHFVGTLSDTGDVTSKIYIDGFLKNTSTFSGKNLIADSNPVIIGAYGPGGYAEFFTGYLDEVKIYPYARSASQILEDYNGGAALLGGGQQNSPEVGGGGLSSGLVAYYNMDTGTGTTIADLSGNNNTGTLSGAGWTTGKFGVGTSFDGNNDYVDAGNSDVLKITGDVTLSAWIKTSSTNSWSGIISRFNSSRGGFSMHINDNSKASCNVAYSWPGTIGSANSTSNVTTNTWTHLTCLYDGSSIKIYINGILENTTSYSSGISATFDQNLQIGKDVGYASGRTLNGLIDEVRIYNRALSASEVKELYNWAPGPVLHLKMDENTGTTAYDSSGNSNNATLASGNSAPTWSPGKFGSALSFDGNNDFINCGNILTNFYQFSISAWLKIDTVTDVNYSGPWGQQNFSYPSDSDSYEFFTGTNTAFGSSSQFSDGTYFNTRVDHDIDDKKWHYITQIYNGDTIKQYDNGILVNTTDVDNDKQLGNDLDFHIGKVAGYPGNLDTNYFDGSIDDVRIYNYARTPEQILQDMYADAPNSSGQTLHPIAHWSFDEGHGTTAHDQIGTNHGTLGSGTSSPTWTNNGKLGKALSFDGNDYINMGNLPSLDIGTHDLTISAWINTNINDLTNRAIVGKFQSSGYYLNLREAKVGGRIRDSQTKMTRGNTEINNNQWHYVATTLNRDGDVNIYVDGKKDATPVDITSENGNITGENFKIGSNSLSNSDFFIGLIDEVKIYNYALSADEVALDYNQGKTAIMGQTTSNSGTTAPTTSSSAQYCIPGDPTACAPPVAEWNFNENQGTTAYDTSGNGNDGTLGTGDSAPTWTKGHSSSGLSLDGNDYISVTNSNTINTISLWVHLTQLPASTVFPFSRQGYNRDIQILANGKVRFQTAGSSQSIDSISTLATNQWQNITAVTDSGIAYIYINGTLDIGGTPTINDTVGNLNFGRRISDLNYYYSGLIDQVRIYDYARSPAQIAWDYNKGAPVAWYPLDECQGTTVHSATEPYDSSLNGTINIGAGGSQTTVGTCSAASDAAAWYNGATGKLGASLNFDDTDDYIEIEHSSSIEPEQELTYCAWIKPSNLESGVIIQKNDLNVSPYRAKVLYLNNGELFFHVYHGTNSYFDTNQIMTQDVWSHVCATVKDNGYVKMFLNGKNIYTSDPIGDILLTDDEELTIGARLHSSSPALFFSGQIDDVRIYNYALTADQVKTLYNNGAVNFSN